MKGVDAIGLVGFGWEGEKHQCFKPGCGSTLTAKQTDGAWACPFHWSGEVQLEMELGL